MKRKQKKARKQRETPPIRTLAELAPLVGRDLSTVSRWAKRDDWPFTRQPPWPRTQLIEIVQWAADTFGPKGETKDPLLLGEDSPALERYREERAKLARLDRLEREGSLIPREHVHQGFSIVATVMRGAIEVLQRQFGSEAHRIMDEALQDAQRQIDGKFADHNDPNAPGVDLAGATDAGAEAQDDAPIRGAGNNPAKRAV